MIQKFLLLSCVSVIGVQADQVAFEFNNDYFARTDKHYTNGGALSWIDEQENNSSSLYRDTMKKIADQLPFIDPNRYANNAAGISLSQFMYTPTDTTKKTPQYDDMPYAGYLALSFFELQWDQKSVREFRVDFGVLGDIAGSGLVQDSFHTLIREAVPQGWNTQIPTHYTFNALYRYGEISWQKRADNGLEMDWFNQGGVQVGSYEDDAFASSVFRFGKNYPHDFNVHYPYMKEEASLLHVSSYKDFGWSISLGMNAEALAYLYPFSKAKSMGYNSTTNPVDATAYLGTDFYFKRQKLTFFYQAQSSYIMAQKEVDIFGGFIYSYQF